VLQFPKLDLEQLADLLQTVRSCFLYLFYWCACCSFNSFSRPFRFAHIKVAHLNFVRPQQQIFEHLILHCQSSVQQATSHISYTLNRLSKNVSLFDIGVTLATQWWHHAFYMFPIFSTFKPKLWKQPHIPSRPHADLPGWNVVGNSMRSFSRKFS